MNSTGSIPADAFSLRSAYGRRAIGLSVAAAVGGFLFGFDSSVINGAVDSISKDFALNDVITGFVVAIAGDIMTMPGLPKVPSAENIYLDENGQIEGLF